MEQELSLAAGQPVVLQFTPHLVPVNRGILTTLYLSLGTLMRAGSQSGSAILRDTAAQSQRTTEIHECFQQAYGNEPFVRLLGDKALPDTKNVVGTNVLEIAWRLDPRTGRLMVMSAEDNLVKGASGQALQSLNLMCGWPETTGLL